jgi:Rieske Fe-S protein
MAEEKPRSSGISRREFLAVVIGGAAAAVAAALTVPLAGYFLTPLFAKQGTKSLAIAGISQIPVGTPIFVTYKLTARDGWINTTQDRGAWVVTQNGKDYVVFDSHCTHLGCLFSWNPASHLFECPCHGSEFDINGGVVKGPAPIPLVRIPFTVANGQIEIAVPS